MSAAETNSTSEADGGVLGVAAGRIPIVMTVTDILSGVTSWALRLREAFRGHPRYALRLLACNTDANRSPGYDGYLRSRREWTALLESLPEAVVIPNYVWDCYDLALRGNRRAARWKLIGYCHADSEQEYYRPLEWYGPYTSEFVAVSSACADRLGERLGGRSVPVIPYGVVVPPSLPETPRSGPLRLLYSGRLAVEQKRVLDLVELCDALIDRGVDFRLDLVGRGPAEPALRSALGSTRRRGRLVLVGARSPAEMLGLYADYDVLVLVSQYEGTSNSLLEGMAQGLVPAVTRTSSGIDGVVEDDENGLVVPIGSMRELADRIAALARDETRYQRLRSAAHASARQFSIEDNVSRLSELFDAATPVAGPPPGRRPDFPGEVLGPVRKWMAKQRRRWGAGRDQRRR